MGWDIHADRARGGELHFRHAAARCLLHPRCDLWRGCLRRCLIKEEGHVPQTFLKSFRANFRQATVLWLICAVIGVVLWQGVRVMTAQREDLLAVYHGGRPHFASSVVFNVRRVIDLCALDCGYVPIPL